MPQRSRATLSLLAVMSLVACVGSPSSSTTTSTTPALPVTTTPSSTTAPPTTAPPSPCPPPPYELSVLPPAVVAAPEGADASEPDKFTSIGGTNTSMWVGATGDPAIALIRGTLPPNQFPAERGEVDVAGARGVAGPYPDGRWVVAWFNEPADRCDQYTMVFYPPVSPEEVEATLAGMERVPG